MRTACRALLVAVQVLAVGAQCDVSIANLDGAEMGTCTASLAQGDDCDVQCMAGYFSDPATAGLSYTYRCSSTTFSVQAHPGCTGAAQTRPNSDKLSGTPASASRHASNADVRHERQTALCMLLD